MKNLAALLNASRKAVVAGVLPLIVTGLARLGVDATPEFLDGIEGFIGAVLTAAAVWLTANKQ